MPSSSDGGKKKRKWKRKSLPPNRLALTLCVSLNEGNSQRLCYRVALPHTHTHTFTTHNEKKQNKKETNERWYEREMLILKYERQDRLADSNTLGWVDDGCQQFGVVYPNREEEKTHTHTTTSSQILVHVGTTYEYAATAAAAPRMCCCYCVLMMIM